jgi:manganese/zinc/iron transport system permease protein
MIGLQTVGVVLMAAMVIGPGIAARQWTDKLSLMLVLAGTFGAVSGIVGAVASVLDEALPTGPMIIMSLTAIVAVSILFAPRHGMIPDQVRLRRQRRLILATRAGG